MWEREASNQEPYSTESVPDFVMAAPDRYQTGGGNGNGSSQQGQGQGSFEQSYGQGSYDEGYSTNFGQSYEPAAFAASNGYAESPAWGLLNGPEDIWPAPPTTVDEVGLSVS